MNYRAKIYANRLEFLSGDAEQHQLSNKYTHTHSHIKFCPRTFQNVSNQNKNSCHRECVRCDWDVHLVKWHDFQLPHKHTHTHIANREQITLLVFLLCCCCSLISAFHCIYLNSVNYCLDRSSRHHQRIKIRPHLIQSFAILQFGSKVIWFDLFCFYLRCNSFRSIINDALAIETTFHPPSFHFCFF